MGSVWSISIKIRNRLLFSVAVGVLLLVAGCATTARYESGYLDQAAAAALPADRTVYLYLDVRSAAGLIDSLAGQLEIDPGNFAGVLENGRSLFLAADTQDRAMEGWTSIVTGDFPMIGFSAALNCDRNWKRVYGSGRYWISSSGDMELALPVPQVVVAGTQNVQTVANRLSGGGVIDTVAALQFYKVLLLYRGRGLVAYTEQPGRFMPLELPGSILEGCTAAILGDFGDSGIGTDFVLWFPSQVKARVAGLLMKTLVIAETRKGTARLKEAQVTVDGETVTVGPILIEPQEILSYIKTAFGTEEHIGESGRS